MTRNEINAILRDIRENQLPKWQEMTARNAHGERVEATANYFAGIMAKYDSFSGNIGTEFAELCEVAKFINKRHFQHGRLVWSLGVIRDNVVEQIEYLVEKFIGADCVELINK